MAAKPTYEEALSFMADAVLHQRIDFTGPWQGWKLRGRHLVSPDGDRMLPGRLVGLAWRFQAEARRDAARAKREAAARPGKSVVTVLRIPNDDWHRERFGSLAG